MMKLWCKFFIVRNIYSLAFFFGRDYSISSLLPWQINLKTCPSELDSAACGTKLNGLPGSGEIYVKAFATSAFIIM